MASAAILKNCNNSALASQNLTKLGMVMHLDPLDPSANKISKFLKAKMAATAILNNKNSVISKNVRPILTRFGTLMQLNSPVDLTYE